MINSELRTVDVSGKTNYELNSKRKHCKNTARNMQAQAKIRIATPFATLILPELAWLD